MFYMQLNKVFSDWLHARKITDAVIEMFELRVENDRLVIPVLNSHGIFLFNKYRRSPLSDEGPKYTYDKGGKLALYGADKIADKKTVLWCEGELDALVAWSVNIPAVSGTGGAMSISPQWIELFGNTNIETIICFDNDPAGGEGMVKALELVPWAKVLFLPDKPGVKDISDYVAHGGNLNELVKSARTFSGVDDVLADKAERESKWMSVHFHTAYVKYHTKPAPKARKERDPAIKDRVLRAKAYPIDELLQFNHSGSARCLFHNETEASLHYYKDQNKTWCFGGCGRGYDAIDIYQKLHNVSFMEAVKALQ